MKKVKPLRKCQDCGQMRKLMLHHDPPRSRRVMTFEGSRLKDENGELKEYIPNNKRLCNKCHRKADIALGLKRAGFKYHKKKSTWPGKKYRQGKL